MFTMTQESVERMGNESVFFSLSLSFIFVYTLIYTNISIMSSFFNFELTPTFHVFTDLKTANKVVSRRENS